jgi:hypothetical protein
MLTIARIAVSTSLHQDSRVMMVYARECLRPILYDWSTSLLMCMKAQLTRCKQGKMKNFIFGNHFCFFFFERVPMMSPKVDIYLHYMRDGVMDQWTKVLLRQGGGYLGDPKDDSFFAWSACQVVEIEDYPYVGIHYLNDPEIPIPLRSLLMFYADIIVLCIS